MIEMHILQSAKETDNKLRWDALIDKTKFSLYIPKWRVPEPWPSTIFVSISAEVGKYTTYDPVSAATAEKNPSVLSEPILTMLEWVSDHSQTVRYAPSGDPKQWEIGEPYIPRCILPQSCIEPLLIEVNWGFMKK